MRFETAIIETTYLPTIYKTEEHQGVMAAWDFVVKSRPPRKGCKCYGAWAFLRKIEARVLCYYPRVAERLTEALEQYAASPLDPRTLYHWPMRDAYVLLKTLACEPHRIISVRSSRPRPLFFRCRGFFMSAYPRSTLPRVTAAKSPLTFR